MQITEVKQSKGNENVEHIEPIELKNKPLVYSQAHFVRIKTGENTNKLSLKIGRYKKSEWFNMYLKTGKLEVTDPKSELTLDNEELDNLVTYINQHYYPLANNESKYLSVNDDMMSTLIREKPESISKLINVALENDLDLSDINKLIEISDRKKALKEFQENYNNDVNENIWQKWFEKNSWVLGTDFVRISDDRRIDVKNISDFIAENLDGFIDVIEIKKVGESKKFYEAKENHENLVPSSELTRAITQLANYLSTLEHKANEKDTSERIGNILKPRGILIYGSSKDWSEKEYRSFRLLNATLSNITIYTYDMIFRRAKKINEFLSK